MYIMSDEERQLRLLYKKDFELYAKKCLKIRTKSSSIQDFALNPAQRYIHKKIEEQKITTGKVRAIVLKGRQQGCSTYVEGRFYWLVTHRLGYKAFILTHAQDATQNLFEMAQRYHEYCPWMFKQEIKASNAKELAFTGIDSGYRVGTAGNKNVGRSSTIQLLHGSEVASWPNADEHAKGILQAVPNEKGTEIILESTAKGVGGYFNEQWQMAEIGRSEFIPIFIPWFWQPEYNIEPPEDFTYTEEEEHLSEVYKLTASQLAWRRNKIVELSVGELDGTRAFHQEYPSNPAEAFTFTGEDNLISPKMVMNARKTECEAYGPLIVGVDPARFGDDRSSIIRRKGRVAYGLRSYLKWDLMELCGEVHQIILKENPTKVCIDICGLGAGLYDRLKELGHGDIIVPVNAGSTPLNRDRYFNKRAEMWGEMREWLLDHPCQIPDSDTLHADLCCVKVRPDSKSRVRLEEKEATKKRGLRSPDEADALSLTFAVPDNSLLNTTEKKNIEIAQSFRSMSTKLDRLKKDAYRGYR